MNAPDRHLTISRHYWEQMRNHVTQHAPLEACGLLAGRDGRCLEVFPITNILDSPHRYRMHPQQQVRALHHIHARGWQLLGIFHSHPAGPPSPSPVDIAEAHYPEAAHLIWSPSGPDWACRAFLIQDGGVTEIDILLV